MASLPSPAGEPSEPTPGGVDALGVTVVNEALDPLETQFVLPAGKLTAGRSYTATVSFPQTVDLQITIPADLSGIHIGQVNLVSATSVRLTPVPEPAATLLVAAAALGGLAVQWTRRGRCPARPGGGTIRASVC